MCFNIAAHGISDISYCKDVINICMSSLTGKVNNCSKNDLSLPMTFKRAVFVMLNLCLVLMPRYLMLNKLKLNLCKAFPSILFLLLLYFPLHSTQGLSIIHSRKRHNIQAIATSLTRFSNITTLHRRGCKRRSLSAACGLINMINCQCKCLFRN